MAVTRGGEPWASQGGTAGEPSHPAAVATGAAPVRTDRVIEVYRLINFCDEGKCTMNPRRGKKGRFQVEALEGRIALSSDVPLSGPAGVSPVPAVVAPDGADASEPTLHSGDHGPAVKVLQQDLLQLHYDEVGTVDGVFGTNTTQAVVHFQKDKLLKLHEGIVGPETWSALDEALKPSAAGVTTEQLHHIMPRLPQADLERYIGVLNGMLKEFHIDTPKREAAFLAQVAVESAELTEWSQIGNPDKWRGRGPIQLTGRDAYVNAAQDLGYDIVKHPELVADTSHPTIGFRTSGWFWSNYKAYAHLNATADSVNPSDPASVEHVNQVITRVVNGGTNGLSARLRYYKLALQVLYA